MHVSTLLNDFFHAQNWFKTGNANNLRYIAVHEICKECGAIFCMSLPVVHALTGCDPTSSLIGIGKKPAFKILSTKISELQSLYDLGDLVEVQMDSDAVNDTIRFAIWFYDKAADINQFTEIRYIFAQKTLNSQYLPPTDAFIQHVISNRWSFLSGIYLEKCISYD